MIAGVYGHPGVNVWLSLKLVVPKDSSIIGPAVYEVTKKCPLENVAMNMVKYLSSLRLMPPGQAMGLLSGSWAVQTIKTAIDLGVFEALCDGPRNAVSVAESLSIDVKGAGLILDALVGMQFLCRADLSGTRSVEPIYELNMFSQTYFLKGSPLFLGMFIEHHSRLDEKWRHLSDVVRLGQPVAEVNKEEQAEEMFPHLAEALVGLNYCYAADACKEVVGKLAGPLKVLDIAAGSGVWSIPFAQANRKTTITALDFPAVLEVTARVTERFGVGSQYTTIAGDWRKAELAADQYDVIILGHILHSEGAADSRELIKVCHRALKSGGMLVIAEFMPNQERTTPVAPLLFALNMYLLTTSGCVFSFEELSTICMANGFKSIYRHQGVEYDSPVMFAAK